jgi:hypothetical protein
MSRVLSATAFAAAALAFTLPFGVVTSCDGAEVHFTGAQVAAYSVPARHAKDEGLRDDLEQNAGPFALAALLAAVFGVALSVLGRTGAGICAAVGIVAMQLLQYATIAVSDGGSDLGGFWLAFGSFVAAGVVCLVRELRSRRRARRSVWPAIGYAVAVVLPPLGLIVAAVGALIAVLSRAARRGPVPGRPAI